jgi:hypothetical protein
MDYLEPKFISKPYSTCQSGTVVQKQCHIKAVQREESSRTPSTHFVEAADPPKEAQQLAVAEQVLPLVYLLPKETVASTAATHTCSTTAITTTSSASPQRIAGVNGVGISSTDTRQALDPIANLANDIVGVAVNNAKRIYVERYGKSVKSDDNENYKELLEKCKTIMFMCIPFYTDF